MSEVIKVEIILINPDLCISSGEGGNVLSNAQDIILAKLFQGLPIVPTCLKPGKIVVVISLVCSEDQSMCHHVTIMQNSARILVILVTTHATRCPGNQGSRCPGTQGSRCPGARGPRCLGAQAAGRSPGVQVPRCPGAHQVPSKAPRCPDAQAPRRPCAKAPRCSCTRLVPRCPSVQAPSDHLSRHPVAQWPRCPGSQAPWCPGALVPRRPGAHSSW